MTSAAKISPLPKRFADKKFARVRIADLRKDLTYQRDETKNLSDIIKNWNELACKAINVSRRDDGSLWVLDGWHRVRAASQHGYTDIFAEIHEGLTLRQEATLFVLLNNMQNMLAWYCFRASVRGGLKEESEIEREFEGRGFSIVERKFMGVRAAEWIYGGCGAQVTGGPARLGAALDTYLASWPLPKDVKVKVRNHWIDADVLKALALLPIHYGDALDLTYLAGKLSKKNPKDIIVLAKHDVGGTLYSRVAGVIVKVHNEKAGKRLIAPWNVSTRSPIKIK